MKSLHESIQLDVRLILVPFFCAVVAWSQGVHAQSSGQLVERIYAPDGIHFTCKANAGMTNAEWEAAGGPAEYRRCIEEAARVDSSGDSSGTRSAK